MRQFSLALAALITIFCNQIFAQDYTPTKETVPDISRYKARLELKKVLNKCTDKYNFLIIGRGLYNYIYKLTGSTLDNDKLLQLDFINWVDEKPTDPRFYAYAEMNDLTVEITKKEDAKTYISKPGAGKYDRLYIRYCGFDTLKHLADLLYILKHKSVASQDSADKLELDNFKITAQQYRSLATKPDLNEDARRFLVQATTATEEKRYIDAIDLLERAIVIDAAYPQAHFNRALLWAQVSIYGAAILEMKKYLMLLPDAADARASQDKIYEWEGKLNK